MVMHYTYLYARASTDRQEDSPDTQELKAKRWHELCEMTKPNPRPWRETFADINQGRETKFSERPDGKRLLRSVVRGDLVLVTEFDRLGCKLMDVLETLDTLKKRGVEVRILNFMGGELDPSSRIGELIIAVMAYAAGLEKDNIRDRCQRGRDRIKAIGARFVYAPIGYRCTDDPPLFMVPDPVVQKALEHFHSLCDNGMDVKGAHRKAFVEPGILSYHNPQKMQGSLPSVDTMERLRRKYMLAQFEELERLRKFESLKDIPEEPGESQQREAG